METALISPRFVLASQSPRRKSLLTQLGYQFECMPANIDESVIEGESAKDYVSRLALEKAQCVAIKQPEKAVVLGSDTTVVYQGEILGKPENVQDCVRILTVLSGTKHQVLTAVAVVCDQKSEVQVIKTDVLFKEISEAEILNYWQTGEPQDKAGAYGLQGIGGQFVISIQGSYSAVVGLPLYETVELLKSFNVGNAVSAL